MLSGEEEDEGAGFVTFDVDGENCPVEHPTAKGEILSVSLARLKGEHCNSLVKRLRRFIGSNGIGRK